VSIEAHDLNTFSNLQAARVRCGFVHFLFFQQLGWFLAPSVGSFLGSFQCSAFVFNNILASFPQKEFFFFFISPFFASFAFVLQSSVCENSVWGFVEAGLSRATY
jgi:hypothetical protein